MATQKKTHDNLASALAAAQGEMSNASKNAKNPHFKSTYADLASLRDAVIPILAAHGIACIQLCDGDGQTVSVTTRLLFGAESMDCGRLTISISGARNPAQAAGAAITYARRYQLGAVAGVAATEDDDGNSLDGTRAAPARPARMDKAGQARAILSEDIKCKTKEEAEAAIRFATDYRLGAADLDTEGDEILSALHSLRSDCGGDWTGYLKSAVRAWEAQA
tara:strand:- start:1129 stop:1791 length:663 start_codon:yes stop_codon:yes gene_type:complete